MSEKFRWRVAALMDRLPWPRQCWTELVSWALDGPKGSRKRGDNPLPWRPAGSMCRDYDRWTGACYCGKFRDPEEAQ